MCELLNNQLKDDENAFKVTSFNVVDPRVAQDSCFIPLDTVIFKGILSSEALALPLPCNLQQSIR